MRKGSGSVTGQKVVMSYVVGNTRSSWVKVLAGTDDRGAMDAAARVLWERYFDRLVRLARSWLRNARNSMDDGEDVALSAIDSFCRRAAEGKFPQLDDRHDLWRILVTIAYRKAAKAYRHSSPSTCEDALLDLIIGDEPSPELAAEVADQLRRLLAALPNDGYRKIALKKMEGYTNAEIAEDLGCCTTNVEYKLRTIRATWRPLLTEE
jgi:DNA-directed RNA polymerase specialized sigma24 family protein